MARTLTLTDPPGTLALPAQMQWTDEYAWSAASSSRGWSVGGALLLDAAARLAGRPVTLAGTRDRGWVSLAEARALWAWSQMPAAAMTLVWDAQTLQVTWDTDGGRAPMDVELVQPWADPEDADPCIVTLRLITL